MHADVGPVFLHTILETLPLYPKLATPGLLNSTLYDVIATVPNAAGEVTVNATQFQIDCGVMPSNATIDGYAVSEDLDSSVIFNVDFDDNLLARDVDPGKLSFY